ncbi:beta-galactosidase [Acidovorax sp. NO-1]|uniref:beta-galactosidase n=1 Tax=Acidovorax sp. NO-1 TaxID=512030 RepID=UPI000555CB7F|nr:beta-galactosidase [Acidovorax sp. NO-1]
MTCWPGRQFATLTILIAAASSAKTPPHAVTQRTPMIVAPTVQELYLCDEAIADTRFSELKAALAHCNKRKLTGAPAISRLLDVLEPGGPKGNVQVGYTATLPLLSLYRNTTRGWTIDKNQVDRFLSLIAEIQRPVVVYFLADHFDSESPLAEALAKDKRNLMQLRDGMPLKLDYFGYRIVPYTMSTDPAIPVNKYRFEALDYLAKRINALPKPVQNRIVAYTLAGELHHMFPNFESGMGAYQDIQVTDYSADSVAGFRRWLEAKYKTIQQLNTRHGFAYTSFDQVPAPSKDIRKEQLVSFAEHYDAYADGTLPIAGWLWDPRQTIERLELYVDGKPAGAIAHDLNRLDVYRAEESITTPNTGYRVDFDYSAMAPGRHLAQVVAHARSGTRHKLGEVEFAVVPRDQGRVNVVRFSALKALDDIKRLPGVRTWLDMPRSLQDVYYNPLARDWNQYRESQVYGFLNAFYERAIQSGLPADKLYSHQIVPRVNSSWNPQLFAADQTLQGIAPWKHGLNMYGGATDSAWMRSFIARNKISDYGAPEFNPQQWKRDGVHLAAMQSHYAAGARFISPYYFSVIPDRFKGNAEHGVNRMELGPNNPKDGSDRFYRAIIEFAKQ